MPSAVHENVGGIGSALPPASVAMTWNVWSPFSTLTVRGDVQATSAAPSSEHLNVEPGSSDENVKIGLGSLDALTM